jgi:hypothetical protein
MNKFFRMTSVITVLIALIVFAGVTAAFAQGPNQPDGSTLPGMNQAQNAAGAGMGLMAVDEAAMHEAVAGALSLTVEQFEAQVANGENAYTLAQKLGVDFATVQAAMDAAHAAALQQAVNDGLIARERADWMLSRRGGQNGQGAGLNQGQSASPNGKMGHGAGSNGSQMGDCLYLAP